MPESKNNKSFWLGIDLAAKTLDAAIAFEDAEIDQWRKVPTKHFDFDVKGIRAMLSWIKQIADPQRCVGICAEATGQLADKLQDLLTKLAPKLTRVSVVNPRMSVRFGQSLGVVDKSDRIDCAILAFYGRTRKPQPKPERSEAQRELRELSRARADFTQSITRWTNRLATAQSKQLRDEIKKQIKAAQSARKSIDKRIAELIKADEQLRRDHCLLKSIPGIASITAAVLLAELGDLRLYTRSQIVSYCGLYPAEYTSGTSVRKKPRMVHAAGGRIKCVLFNGARSLFHSKPNLLRAFLDGLCQRGKTKMCALGALMRKMLIVARAVLKSGKVYQEKISINAFLTE